MSVVYAYHYRGVFKNVFRYGCCSLLDEGAEPQFLCTQGTLQGGRVEDHRMMFIRHLHLLQSYIQAILHIYKTDYMMCLMTVNIL